MVVSATDELRKLLDERGVEHYDGTERTLWGYERTGEDTGIYRFAASELSGGHLQFDMFRVTPEQAIAATLGRGECEWVLEHSGTLYDKWRCSKCGYLFVESRVDQGIKDDFDPNYCPNCGAKVVDE